MPRHQIETSRNTPQGTIFFLLGLLALLQFVPHADAAVTHIKGIDVIVKKQPTGQNFVASTDPSGTVRFHLDEPGEYVLEIRQFQQQPKPPSVSPARPREASQNQASAPSSPPKSPAAAAEDPIPLPIAAGRMATSLDPNRVRLEHPNIEFNRSGRSHFETLTTSGPTDLMLRFSDATPEASDALTAAPMNLPPHMSFVAIEGGPKALTPVGGIYQITYDPIDRFIATFSKNTGRTAAGSGDAIGVTVDHIGLAAGL